MGRNLRVTLRQQVIEAHFVKTDKLIEALPGQTTHAYAQKMLRCRVGINDGQPRIQQQHSQP